MYSVASSDKATSATSTVHRNSGNGSGVESLSRKADNKNSDSLSFLINRSSFSVQAKVKIGKPDDKFEKEADSVAEKVMTSPASIGAPQVQKQEKEEEKAQTKPDIQKQEKEEEKAQAKPDIQMQEKEEEKAQAKPDIQKQEEKKEEVAQTKPVIQKQEEKKEEAAQTKPLIQRQKEEESVQTKAKPRGKKEKKKEGIKYIVNVDEPEKEPKEEVQAKQINRKASTVQLRSSGSQESSNTGQSSFEGALKSSKGGGSPLPAETRTYMETNMGADFSGVRMHTGGSAVQMSNQINAQAFTHGNDIYFNEGKYNPGSSQGKSLIAHELTHTVQQGASVQKKSAQSQVRKKSSHSANNQQVVQRSWYGDAWDAVSDVASSAVELVSEGLEAGLNWIKEKFTNFVKGIPGYKLLSVVLGQDPITGNPVARNGRNFIEAGLDIIPFGGLFKRKLEATGALNEAAAWLDNQIAGLDISLGAIKADISAFWKSLSLSDIGNASAVLERAANIIRRPIGKIITFAANVATEFLRIIKNYVLSELVLFIKNNTRGYPLLTVILGKDPITEEIVERNGMNLIKGFMMLSADGEEQLRQMQETGSLQKAADWIDTAVAELDLSWETIKALFSDAWNLITIENLMSPIETFQKLANLFAAPVGRIIMFVIKVGLKILEFIKNALLKKLSDFAHKTRGFHLITVIIGKDPFTGDVVERNPENVIRGFMSLMDGGEEQFQQMKQTGAIKKTTDRIDAAVAKLGFTWEYITGLFMQAWNSFSLKDLAAPFEAFARIVKLFGGPILRLIAFVWEILKIVIEVLLIIMNFPFKIVNNIITKSMQAINDIKKDPIGFLKNILRAIKQGFVQFFDNILKHLLFGLTGWLFGELKDAGINPPKDFTFKSVLGFVLEVLGITMEKIWKKLADKIGQDKVDKIRGMIDKLEGIWKFVKDVATRGPIAIWEYIVEKLSDLWNVVLDAVRNWVMTKIIEQVTVKLLSMLDPTGIMAVVNSVIAIYKAIQSFIRYLREMLEIVNSFVNGVAEIAKGNIKAAADYVENAMHNSMPVIIGFLANQVGLGGVGKKIGEIIQKVRQKVDEGIGWLVDKAVNAGTAFLNMLKSGVTAVKEGVSNFLNWWKVKKDFKSPDGADHSISIKDEKSHEITVASDDPKSLDKIIADLKPEDDTKKKIKSDLVTHKKDLYKFIEDRKIELKRKKEGDVKEERTKQISEGIDKRLGQIQRLLIEYGYFGEAEGKIPLSNVTYAMSNGRSSEVIATPLTKNPGNTKGEPADSAGEAEDPLGHEHTRRLNDMKVAMVKERDLLKKDLPGAEGDAKTKLEQEIQEIDETQKKLKQYNRVHLLSHQLHGPAKKWNFVAAETDVNTTLKAVEHEAKNFIEPGGNTFNPGILSYVAKVTYHPKSSKGETVVPNELFPSTVRITTKWAEMVGGSPKYNDSKPPADKKFNLTGGTLFDASKSSASGIKIPTGIPTEEELIDYYKSKINSYYNKTPWVNWSVMMRERIAVASKYQGDIQTYYDGKGFITLHQRTARNLIRLVKLVKTKGAVLSYNDLKDSNVLGRQWRGNLGSLNAAGLINFTLDDSNETANITITNSDYVDKMYSFVSGDPNVAFKKIRTS